jgi:hypothetical protein
VGSPARHYWIDAITASWSSTEVMLLYFQFLTREMSKVGCYCSDAVRVRKLTVDRNTTALPLK